VEHPAILSTVAEAASGHTQDITEDSDSGNSSIQFRTTSIKKQTDTECLSIVRESLKVRGLSQKVTDIVLSSWRGGTQKQYAVYIRRWRLFCNQREINLFQPSVAEALDFLVEMYELGIGYSAMNTARCALSSFIMPVNNVSFGAQPLVIRFMKGIFHRRPTRPRYEHIWDVSVVLNYLKTLSPVRDLSLKDLSLKLITLIALTTGQRGQSLHLINLCDIKKSKSTFTIVISDLVKQSRPGVSAPALRLNAYPVDRRLCVYTIMCEYLRRTMYIEKNMESKLFISYIKPHKAISRDTVSRWIRTVLQRSGVDVTMFKPHSVRAAAVSAAKYQKVPIEDILRTAGWGSECTFRKYYDLPITDENVFANRVLARV
jgi:integrase